MDYMVDKDLIKNLRIKHGWSQDQLASISGLSLRTIQRIENEGTCSLESKKALAAAFEVKLGDLDTDVKATQVQAAHQRGQKYGLIGAGVGLACAYLGISISLIGGSMTSGEAGVYYGGTAAFCGLCCALIGVLSRGKRVA